MDKQEKILNEVTKANRNLDGMRRTLFGDDGQGGLVKTTHDLQSTVWGINSSNDDRGLMGDVRDIKEALLGSHKKPGMISELRDVKRKQSIWNKSLTGGQLLAWIGLAWRMMKG